MKVKDVHISEIKPAKYNPRKISDSAFEGLKESIKKFGMVDPLIVNKRTGNLVGGHQRLKACEALGFQKVPVVEVDLSKAEEKALNVTLNNQAISGEYEMDQLEELLKEIELDIPEFEDLKLDQFDVNTPDFEFNPDTKNDASDKIKLVVNFKDMQEREELFQELKDRGFSVTA